MNLADLCGMEAKIKKIKNKLYDFENNDTKYVFKIFIFFPRALNSI